MDERLIREIVEKAIEKLVTKDDTDNLISALQDKLENAIVSKLDELKKPLEERIEKLEDKIALYESHMEKLETKIDDQEQYSRRSSLRIFGIPLPPQGHESVETCKEKVQKVFDEMKVQVPKEAIDRVHRIGRWGQNQNGTPLQAMIVKFKSWTHKLSVYRARKNFKDKSIMVDLTPRRADLLKQARDIAKLKSNISFAFADINCRIGVRTVDDNFQFFNSRAELLALV